MLDRIKSVAKLNRKEKVLLQKLEDKRIALIKKSPLLQKAINDQIEDENTKIKEKIAREKIQLALSKAGLQKRIF